MSIADFVVLGVRPRYPHVESECPRVEGDGVWPPVLQYCRSTVLYSTIAIVRPSVPPRAKGTRSVKALY
eukprot:scaffold97455_cov78-Attheya_sp.AAC.4